MRLLYLPNETTHDGQPFRQRTGRAGFGALLTNGRLSALDIYPYYERIAALPSERAFADELLHRVREFGPDIIFIQHLPRTGIMPGLWDELRRANPSVALIYHEADVYGGVMKPIHRNILDIAAFADLNILCAFGHVYDTLRARGAVVGYLPHCYDGGTFGRSDPPSGPARYDAVLIGNSVHARKLPWLYLPGGRERTEVATRLTRDLGPRFGLFGAGWRGVPSEGAVPFLEQERVLQSARVSVNWDHFDSYPYYFSDRLPISLAAGVPHVTSYHPGYEHFFAGCPGLYWARSVHEVIDCVHWLLNRPAAELRREGLAARDWVRGRLEGEVVFAQAFELSLAALARRRAAGHD